MVNIDTYNLNKPGPVIKTRKVTKSQNATMPGNSPEKQGLRKSDRRRPRPDRRKVRRQVLLDFRGGRDRRSGIDAEA